MSRVSVINPSEYTYDALDAVEDTKKVLTPHDCVDEIRSAARSLDAVSELLVEKIGGMPELQPPNEGIIEAGRCIEEIETFTRKILTGGPPTQDLFDTEDVDIMRQLIACISLQRELKQEKEILTQKDMEHQRELQEEFRKKYFDLQKDISERKEKAKNYEYVKVASAIALAGSTMLFFATDGTSAMLSLGMACASIAQGAAGITKGLLDHENNKKTGDLTFVEHERDEIHQELNDSVRELGEAIQAVMRTWGDLREILTKRMDALRSIR